MREILFRGKAVNNGEWVKGLLLPLRFWVFSCRSGYYRRGTTI